MQVFKEISQNQVLLTGILAWFVAQAAKVVLTLVVDRKIDLKRMFGLGGMPSSHSAVVCALATSCGMCYGFNGPEFAISAILATVVMTDAAGVRRAAGKQARQINMIVQEMIEDGKGVTHERLKELLGHSPLEVSVGAILGIILAAAIV